MALKIKKAEIYTGDKKHVVLADQVKDMGFIGNGAFVVQTKEGTIESYWFCPIKLYQVEVPDIAVPGGTLGVE